MRNVWLATAVVAALAAAPATAGQAAIAQAKSDGIRTEAVVVVEGEQPGPGLWLVRKDDHDLYVLATLRPLPKRMQLHSRQLETVLADAQEVIRAPSISFSVDTGWFSGLMLLPKMLGARNNPDGRTLQQVVSPASYARWQQLKARYIGQDRGVEKRRPLFAAQELYKKAMEETGLDGDKIFTPLIDKAIEAHHPTVTLVREKIVVTDPKPLLKEFAKTNLDDLACFDNTMTQLETDIDAMRARANAWATGDMAALRALPPAYQWEACSNAISEAGIGKRLGFGDARQKLRTKWLAAAEAALARNRISFAMLPIVDVLGKDGYLAALQAKGYTVIAPDE